jgi:hypothetical protein
MVIAADARMHATGVAIAVLAATRIVLAQPTSVAQALFDEGRRLLADGNVAAACAKFAESQRIEPAGGTLMNLAACHAREGKTATAWTEFNDALTQAKRDGRDDRVDEAKRQLAQLEPHLARLTVSVDAAVAAGLTVRLDGTALGPASWGTAIPVDPGDHAVDANAPGRVPWSTHAHVAPESSVHVEVPALAQVQVQPAVPRRGPETPPQAPVQSSRVPVATWILAGVGIAGIGVGSYFGVVAWNKKHDSNPQCSATGCSSAGASLLHQADTAAWGSNIGFGVGVVALAAATYLFLATPSGPSHARTLRVGPWMATQSMGLGAAGAW